MPRRLCERRAQDAPARRVRASPRCWHTRFETGGGGRQRAETEARTRVRSVRRRQGGICSSSRADWVGRDISEKEGVPVLYRDLSVHVFH